MSIFSETPIEKRLFENEFFYIIEDGFPVSSGHLLIISQREVVDYFKLTIEEQNAFLHAISAAKTIIESEQVPDGYNIGFNCGIAAGQTVMHFHCHVIPRFHGDTPDPRGGIRNCLPGKGVY